MLLRWLATTIKTCSGKPIWRPPSSSSRGKPGGATPICRRNEWLAGIAWQLCYLSLMACSQAFGSDSAK